MAFNPNIIPNIMDSSYSGNRECIYTINSHLSKNAVFNDIIIYFPNITRDLVYSSDGTKQINVLEGYLPIKANDEEGDYRAQIGQIRSPVLVPVIDNTTGRYTRDLLYCYPVNRPAGNWYMTVFFVLDGNFIEAYARSIWGDFEGATWIYNSGDRGIFEAQSGIRKSEHAKNTVLRYELSPDLKFVTEIGEKDIERYIAGRQRDIWIIIISVGIAGLALAVFFAIRAYLPIYQLNRILQNVPERKHRDPKENELVRISVALQNILRENQRITGLMQDNTRYMQEQLLFILLNGDAGNDIYENIGDLFSALQINLPGPEYTVFCFYPADGTKGRIKPELSKILRQNLVWHPGSVYPLAPASLPYIPIIVSLGPRLENRLPAQEEFADKFQNLLPARSIEGTLYGGGVYGAIRDIDKAYIEALTMQEQYGSLPGKTLLFSQFQAQGKRNREEELQNSSALLVQSIKKGNADAALENLGIALTQIETLRAGIRKYKVSRLLGDISDTFCRTGFWDTEIAEANLEILVTSTGIPALCKNLSEFITECCGFIKSGDERRRPDGTISAVKEYIDGNFADPSLSLDQAAGTFGISPFHLSREFKRAFNTNFVDYISFLRINRAKHLLAGTNTKIKDIVGMIGYQDVPNFIRKFRIIEGITPGQYRESVSASSPEPGS
jgi:AraC-like DNA-binding protein